MLTFSGHLSICLSTPQGAARLGSSRPAEGCVVDSCRTGKAPLEEGLGLGPGVLATDRSMRCAPRPRVPGQGGTMAPVSAPWEIEGQERWAPE